jgi:hypothetical protein
MRCRDTRPCSSALPNLQNRGWRRSAGCRSWVNATTHRARGAARQQAATASGKSVLLRVDYDAGHGHMDATRRQLLALLADDLRFVLWQTGDPAFQSLKQ